MNHLIHEKSPYLLQHAQQPVDWYAWGTPAFAAARAGNKLIFLSSGYAACHWCHVMAHDAFDQADVAARLNADFICIKVDREELPAVDALCMDAVTAMTGRGGWPLSVFLLPDGRPIWGGTFFWRAQFLQVLEQLSTAWRTKPADMEASAQELTAHLQSGPHCGATCDVVAIDDAFFEKCAAAWNAHFDAVNGGFGGAPKFPPNQGLRWLLRYAMRTGDANALHMVTTTLDAMARGGLYDHVGGGFHRYSTDAQWHVPHFEKMLYDNAQLAVTYCEAFQYTGHTHYATIARETLDYVLRDLTCAQGGFAAAEDADSDGVEGAFYAWTPAALRAALGDDATAEAFAKIFSCAPCVELGDGHCLLRMHETATWASRCTPATQKNLARLRAVRAQRVRPLRDDKMLTDWNGLMIAALATGARILQAPEYMLAAQAAAQGVEKYLWDGTRLYHRYRDGDRRFAASLDDHAMLIHGLLALYTSDGDSHWIDWAATLQATLDADFWDESSQSYFFSPPEDALLIVRQRVWHDHATPSGNSLTLDNLQRLCAMTGTRHYRERALRVRASLAPIIVASPMASAQALVAMMRPPGTRDRSPVTATSKKAVTAVNRRPKTGDRRRF